MACRARAAPSFCSYHSGELMLVPSFPASVFHKYDPSCLHFSVASTILGRNRLTRGWFPRSCDHKIDPAKAFLRMTNAHPFLCHVNNSMFFVYFWATASGAQGLLLTLSSEIIPSYFGESYGIPGQPCTRQMCYHCAITLAPLFPTVLSHWSQQWYVLG